jgi:hypothetical protein
MLCRQHSFIKAPLICKRCCDLIPALWWWVHVTTHPVSIPVLRPCTYTRTVGHISGTSGMHQPISKPLLLLMRTWVLNECGTSVTSDTTAATTISTSAPALMADHHQLSTTSATARAGRVCVACAPHTRKLQHYMKTGSRSILGGIYRLCTLVYTCCDDHHRHLANTDSGKRESNLPCYSDALPSA